MNKTIGTRHLGLALALTATLAAAITVAPLQADTLILRDGSSIETEGPWEVRGAIIVFTLPNGSLSSLRTSKVDLDASAVATVQAATPPAAPEPAPAPEAVLVLTDRDVAHVSPRALTEPQSDADSIDGESIDSSDDGTGDQGDDLGADLDAGSDLGLDDGTDGASPSSAAQRVPVVDRLQVTNWDQIDYGSDSDLGGTTIVGTLVNSSEEIATQIRVTVRLVDNTGTLIASSEATVTAGALRPEQSTTFRADIPGVTLFDNVQFETQNIALAWRPANQQ